jgi:Ca2+-binding RTX toxin-like protein
VETLTIAGPSTAGTVNDFAGAVTMTASAGGSTKMVLTGANEIEFSGAVTTGTLDASALTGELDMEAASGGAMTILGGTAADDIFGSDSADSITGGDGADEIDAGGGADTVAGGAGADDFILNADADLGDTITDFVSGTDDIDYNITLVDDNGNTSVTAGNLTAAMYVDVTGGANATTITGNGDAVIFEFSNAADYLGAGNTVTFDLTTATAAEIKAEVIDQLTTDASVALTDGAISTTELLFIMYDESGNAALIQFDEEDSTAPTTIDAADGIVVAAILTGIEAGGLAVGDII